MQALTKSQLKEIYIYLNHQFYLSIQKQIIIFQYTDGRTINPEKMSKGEATELIKYLNDDDCCDRIKNVIWEIAYAENIITNSFTQEAEKQKPIQLNKFLIENGIANNKIDLLTINGLREAVMLLKSFILDRNIAEADASTKSLLKELNLSVEKNVKSHGN